MCFKEKYFHPFNFICLFIYMLWYIFFFTKKFGKIWRVPQVGTGTELKSLGLAGSILTRCANSSAQF